MAITTFVGFDLHKNEDLERLKRRDASEKNESMFRKEWHEKATPDESLRLKRLCVKEFYNLRGLASKTFGIPKLSLKLVSMFISNAYPLSGGLYVRCMQTLCESILLEAHSAVDRGNHGFIDVSLGFRLGVETSYYTPTFYKDALLWQKFIKNECTLIEDRIISRDPDAAKRLGIDFSYPLTEEEDRQFWAWRKAIGLPELR